MSFRNNVQVDKMREGKTLWDPRTLVCFSKPLTNYMRKQLCSFEVMMAY